MKTPTYILNYYTCKQTKSTRPCLLKATVLVQEGGGLCTTRSDIGHKVSQKTGFAARLIVDIYQPTSWDIDGVLPLQYWLCITVEQVCTIFLKNPWNDTG